MYVGDIKKKDKIMATTTFTVDLVQPIYEFPYGFFVDIKNSGSMSATPPVPARGVEGLDEERGFWVDLKNPFECEGDVAVADSPANILNDYLLAQGFAFNPSNPPYNTVAPYLKDGSTPNPAFDNSQNPVLLVEDTSYGFGTSTRAYRTMDVCRRFAIATSVV
jgi:hypothetical protein